MQVVQWRETEKNAVQSKINITGGYDMMATLAHALLMVSGCEPVHMDWMDADK